MRMQTSRRHLLQSVPLALSQAAPAARFFRVEHRRSQWWLISPGGEPFFSIGMNHIDSATLRYAENIEIWRKRYGNSERRSRKS
jgi:hypothetical protein